jgi:peptidoglycan/LPS O-acetylase OafA/YrhL
MRYVNGFFFVLLLLFAAVQYNDPDAILWILIYGIPAVWAGLAAFRPARFAHSQPLLAIFGVTLLALAAGAVYDWPQSIADWWDNEVVREGLGLIIAVAALLVVAYTLWRTRREAPRLARHAG